MKITKSFKFGTTAALLDVIVTDDGAVHARARTDDSDVTFTPLTPDRGNKLSLGDSEFGIKPKIWKPGGVPTLNIVLSAGAALDAPFNEPLSQAAAA